MRTPSFHVRPPSSRSPMRWADLPSDRHRASSGAAAGHPLDVVGAAWVIAGLAVLSVFIGAVLAGVLRLLSMAASVL